MSVHCPLEPSGLILGLDCLQWAGGGGSGFGLLFRTRRASFQIPGARFLCLLCPFILISVSTSWQRILHPPVWEPGTWNSELSETSRRLPRIPCLRRTDGRGHSQSGASQQGRGLHEVGLSCPSASCTCKVASGLPDLRSKSRARVEYQPGGTACERGPCAPQISAKRHLRLKRRGFGGEEDSRPGAARELGGEPISRLLPGAALPRPAPGQPGRGPAAGGRAAWCSRCSSHEPGGHGGPGGVARLQSAPAVSLRPVHWTPVSLRTQVTEGGTRPQCSPRVSASRAVHPVHALLLSAAGRGTRVLLGDGS